MKINIASKNNGRLQMNGFTLIEMIGVLAVIAILAALLIPKVTSAISDARVNSTVGSYQAIQAAAAGHYAKYNSFDLSTNSMVLPPPITTFDSTVLLPGCFGCFFLAGTQEPAGSGPDACSELLHFCKASTVF